MRDGLFADSLDRRGFLAGGAGLLAAAAVGAGEPEATLDIHVHLFGVGDNGSGCRLAKSITDGLQFQYLTFALGLKEKAKTLDEAYEVALVEQVKGSGLTKAAILGQDAVYD